MTKKSIPVSSTLLILSIFLQSSSELEPILTKTIFSYFFAFLLSFILWDILYTKFKTHIEEQNSNNKVFYNTVLSISTGFLWITWLTSNTANIVVFLPRVFSIYDLILYNILGMSLVFLTIYNRGGPIQKILENKKDINNIKSAIYINLIYGFVLFFAQFLNNLPIATSWVFIGILAGRELAIVYNKSIVSPISGFVYKKSFTIIIKDFLLASAGVLISLLFVTVFKLFII